MKINMVINTATQSLQLICIHLLNNKEDVALLTKKLPTHVYVSTVHRRIPNHTHVRPHAGGEVTSRVPRVWTESIDISGMMDDDAALRPLCEPLTVRCALMRLL